MLLGEASFASSSSSSSELDSESDSEPLSSLSLSLLEEEEESLSSAAFISTSAVVAATLGAEGPDAPTRGSDWACPERCPSDRA